LTSSNTSAGEFEVRSEARGPHWIAWLIRDDADKPVDAVVLVGETREEAETRAREYARQHAARGLA
jgi:succinyl-CoA synthetase alpha subunit